MIKQQLSFAQAEQARRKKPTRRERFLADMDRLVPWAELVALIEPFYGRPSTRAGRPPIGAERMLRMYLVQVWFNLSDESAEEIVYDSVAVRDFIGMDLSRETAPDATTLLQFRHLLERHALMQQLFAAVNTQLRNRGLLIREGTIADATLIAAPPSTKNRARERDPEMHQSKKGNQWYFGMKAHIGVDADSGLTHTVVATAGNVSDVSQTESLLHGEEQHLHGDAGYQLGAEREQRLRDKGIAPQIAARRSRIKVLPEGEYKAAIQDLEKAKASIRAKVEHPFHLVKNRFGYRKARYRGLAKNLARLFVLFMSANLVIAKKWLFSPDRQVASAA